jgi:hypothetical protein
MSVHKGTPLSHIKAQHSIATTTFQWYTPNIFTMPLADDVLGPALVVAIKMQCLTANLTLELACFVSTKEVRIPTTNY